MNSLYPYGIAYRTEYSQEGYAKIHLYSAAWGVGTLAKVIRFGFRVSGFEFRVEDVGHRGRGLGTLARFRV